jgi:alpha-L-fucosidase 2
MEVTVSGTNASVSSSDGKLVVSGADEVLMVIAIDTNYIRYDDITGDPQSKVDATLSAVRGKSFEDMLSAHVSDYQALFNRVSISLGKVSSILVDV